MAAPLSALQSRYFDLAVAACRAGHADPDLQMAAALAAYDLEEAEGRDAYDEASYRAVAVTVDAHMAHRNAPVEPRPLVVECETCGTAAPEADDDPNGECAACAAARREDDERDTEHHRSVGWTEADARADAMGRI